MYTASAATDNQEISKGLGKLVTVLNRFFDKQRRLFAKELKEFYADATKGVDRDLEILLNRLLEQWVELVPDAETEIQQVYDDAARDAANGLGVVAQVDFDALDTAAVAFAKERAAELVGMQWSKNGKLVRNPDAEWAITETVRDDLRSVVTNAIEDGLNPAELADAIEQSYLFSSDRAELIARTELARAHVQGALDTAQDSGVVVAKQWLLGSEHDRDDICDGNADAGIIRFGDDFPSGDDGPPAHPNCVCAVVFYTKADKVDVGTQN